MAVAPRAYAPAALPARTAFGTGGGPAVDLPVFADRALAPGRYGDLVFRGSNELSLSSGDYYFASVQSPGRFVDLVLDLTGGPVNIYVAGDARFAGLSTVLNGRRFAQGGNFAAAGHPLAAGVLLETDGGVGSRPGRPLGRRHRRVLGERTERRGARLPVARPERLEPDQPAAG